MHFHSQVCHQGRGVTISKMRGSGYWIIGCISGVSSVIHHCVPCRRLYRDPVPQKMADLPPDRLEESAAPFTFCGVDIFGPYLIKEGRKTLKRYGVIFVCLCSKAVHIEVGNYLSTDSFINAFRRLVSIRGEVRSLR